MTDRGRRRLLQGSLTLAGLALASGCGVLPVPWQRPAKVPRIGYLVLNADTRNFELFRDGLRELGYVENRTIVIERRWAESTDHLPALAAELVGLPVDLILAAGTTPVKAAMGATRTIPIVFPIIGDPVAAGLVASLARPGGNVTGQSDLAPQLQQKRLQLLRELVPGVSRVTYLEDVAIAEINGNTSFRGAQEAAPSLGMQVSRPALRTATDLPAAFDSAIRDHAEALLVSESPLISGEHEREQIVAFARAARLPLMAKTRPFAVAGGLITYGPDNDALFRRAAVIVDKILKGTPPSEIPIEQPTVFQLIVNSKTAQALGLTIPQSVLQQATEIIQ